MSQFTRKKLSRGVKLLLEHIYTPMQSVATALSNATIQPVAIRESDTSFRVSFWVPQLSGYHMYADTSVAPWANKDGYAFAFPFAIPQPQNLLNSSATINDTTVRYTLQEMSVSFDQRGEPAAVLDANNTPGREGDISHNAVTKLDIKLSLLEKTMLSYNSQAGYEPDREVFSATLSPTFYAGRFLRLNPFLFTELNKDVHPYKSLMLCVQADGLHPDALPVSATDFWLSLPSFMCTMRFDCERIARDTAADNVQNMPAHNGAIATSPFNILTPSANATITADASDGVSTTASLFDSQLLNKLLTGYTKQGSVSTHEHMVKDSGLEVIAVPLWSNFSERGRLASGTVEVAANVGAPPSNGPIVDERWIPINYPFVIHHCILAINYGSPASTAQGPAPHLPTTAGQKPTSATFSSDVGVALFTGQQADESAFQQVAHLNYTVANLADYTIDRIRHSSDSVMTNFDHTFDLVQVPLVNNNGTGLKNLAGTQITQGAPVFVAKGASTLTSENRSQVDGANPATKGAEQYLVVRQSFQDPNGLNGTGAPLTNNEVYAGVGGNWLYLIGKKTVVGGRDPKMTAGR